MSGIVGLCVQSMDVPPYILVCGETLCHGGGTTYKVIINMPTLNVIITCFEQSA